MRSTIRSRFLISVSLVLGCGGPVASPDAALTDAGGPPDTGSPVDAGPVDATSPDAQADAGDPCAACTGERACLRGVCIATCGADVAALEAALAADLVPTGSYCRTPSAVGFGGAHVYEVSTGTVGTLTTFELARWIPGAASLPTIESLASTSYTAGGSEMVFTGGFVAVSPDESHAVFGYTTTLAGSIGGVFDAATGTMLALEMSAPGNFDATFLDATHYVVDGLGLGMAGTQGLYRGTFGVMGGTQVVDHLGQYSGSVAYWEAEGLVLAGGGTFSETWPDGMMGDRMVVFPAADLLSASTPMDAAPAQHVEMPSSFELLHGPRLASLHYDDTFALDGIEVRALSRTGSGPVVVGPPTALTTGDTFTAVASAGADTILAHADGLLFVR